MVVAIREVLILFTVNKQDACCVGDVGSVDDLDPREAQGISMWHRQPITRLTDGQKPAPRNCSSMTMMTSLPRHATLLPSHLIPSGYYMQFLPLTYMLGSSCEHRFTLFTYTTASLLLSTLSIRFALTTLQASSETA